MVLTEKEIRALQQSEHPLIAPFCEDQLQAASYDITLGERVIAFDKRTRTIDLSGQEPQELYTPSLLGPEGYCLGPNEFVLVELQECLTLPADCVAHIRPRSRFTRLGLLVSGQHFNPTYSGKVPIGVFNASPNTLILKQGIRLAQVVFERLSQAPDEDKLYRNKVNAAYMNEEQFRGAVLKEAGWSDNVRTLYKSVMDSLTRE